MSRGFTQACSASGPARPGIPRGRPVTVTDADSEATFSCPPGQTILLAAQAAGWDLPYECASGGCGTCRGQLLSGTVTCLWPGATGLTERDRRRGDRILLCQSRPDDVCSVRVQARLRRAPAISPPPGRHDARVTRLNRLGPGMLALEIDSGQPVRYLAGQFIILEVPDGTRRAYSMSRMAGTAPRRLEMVIREKPGGAMSRWLFGGLTVGSRLTIEGPYGRAYAQSPTGRPVVCVAGGSGLGQMLAIADQCLAEDPARRLTVYYGSRSPGDVVLAERMAGLRERGAEVIAVTESAGPRAGRLLDDAWSAVRTGLVVDAVTADYQDLAGHDVYAAGPSAMVDALLAATVRAGHAAADRFFFDRFWM
jgi:NAD(P)H-flavin reductase/ferredoxin